MIRYKINMDLMLNVSDNGEYFVKFVNPKTKRLYNNEEEIITDLKNGHLKTEL